MIGGGRYGKGFVTINNGTVSTEVYSKYDSSYYLASFGAVIGGGYSGDSYVTINGGKVTVNRRYADVSYGAGIGSGYKGIAEVFINKGDVTVNDIGNGTINGAAIGAASNSDLRNRVVINDGNITVGQSGSGIYNAAGIGGGAQGSIGNINILAGQISAHSQNGFGIGAGKISENESGQTGNIVLGYSNQSNFIEADSFGTDASKISFYSEKEFIIDGTNTLATAESILSGCKLIPKIVGNYSLEYTKVSGVNDKYPYTGSEITIKPVLTDINGTTLNENYHYKVTLTYGDKQVDKVKEMGIYTYTFTTGYETIYYGKQTFVFAVVEPLSPSDLAVTEAGFAGAALSWKENGPATNWILEYSKDSSFSKNVKSINVSGTPEYTLTGLTADVKHYFRVRSVIDNSKSEWSDTAEFMPISRFTVTGDPTDTNKFVPIRTNSKYSFSEEIYTPEEIGEACKLTSIDYFMESTSDGSSSVARNLKVYMMHSDKSDFNDKSWLTVTDNDLVFTGTVTFTAEKWTSIVLDEPFEYNGTDNLAVIVYDYTGTETIESFFRVFNTSQPQTVNNWTGVGNIDPKNASGTEIGKKIKNSIRLGAFYDVNIDTNITGGSVEADKTSASIGETVNLTMTPDPDYDIVEIKYTDSKGVHNIKPVNGVYSFTMPAGNVTVTARFSNDCIPYVDTPDNGTVKNCTVYNVIDAKTTTLTEGWYVVNSDVTNSNRIVCSGDVKIILCNDAELNAVKGIGVNENEAALTIYGQRGGTGKLTIDGTGSIEGTAIGSSENGKNSGMITINGGNITVTSESTYAAAIGGSSNGDGNVTINGGNVTVDKNNKADPYTQGRYLVSDGAGIGGGNTSPNTSINITGGQVIVNNKPMLSGNQPEDYSINGADIGGGWQSFADVTITGGRVVANDTSNGAAAGNGIGAGYQSKGTNITLSWTNPADSITSYLYNGNLTLNQSFVNAQNKAQKFIKGDGTISTTDIAYITLVPYIPKKYSVTWCGEYGIVLYTDSDVEEDTIPEYPGETPTKQQDLQYSYEFAGWSDGTNNYSKNEPLPPVTADTSYIAYFNPVPRKYTIRWMNGSQSLETDYSVPYGTIPEYNGETPTKDDPRITYTFEGWSPRVEAVAGDQDYFAVFSSKTRMYTVTLPDNMEITSGAVFTDSTAAYNTEVCFKAKDGYIASNVSDGTHNLLPDDYGVYTIVVKNDVSISADFAFADGIGATLVGHSISLTGNIGVNFYMELNEDVISDTNAYMHFTLPNGKTKNVTIAQAIQKELSGTTYYIFQCEVAAKEMTANITAQMFSENKEGTVYEYTVKQYCDYVFENAYEADGTTVKNQYYADAAPLIEAMLNYGAYSQTYFNYNTEHLANEGKTNTDVSSVTSETVNKPYDVRNINLPEGITLESANLILESETVMNLYFSNTTGKTLTFTTNGNVTLEQEKDGSYTKAVITDISAQNLDNDITVNIAVEGDNASYSVVYSPMNYCYNVLVRELSPTRTEALKNVMRAFYLYNTNAKAYFSKQNN